MALGTGPPIPATLYYLYYAILRYVGSLGFKRTSALRVHDLFAAVCPLNGLLLLIIIYNAAITDRRVRIAKLLNIGQGSDNVGQEVQPRGYDTGGSLVAPRDCQRHIVGPDQRGKTRAREASGHP